VRRDDAVAAPGPHHGDCRDLCLAALAVLEQHPPEGLVGEKAGEVVDASVPFGLPDHRHHLVGSDLARAKALLEPGGVLDALQLDLCHFDSHRRLLDLRMDSMVSAFRPPHLCR
jgi:hypothetical protein